MSRTLSNNGGGIDSQQRRQSISQLKKHGVTEKELEGEGDERDIKIKQVIYTGCCLITRCSYG